ncbi:hypothetical protein [Streptomyces chartreusis]|uniref:hypothetical protein n=1 Tax=Streptomyces chartreusis TaxID=1969 RepID=UPI0033C83AED
MADEVATIPIQERYAPQLAADLEQNLAAQERLREEERWLRAALGSLPMVSGLHQEAPAVADSASEPPAPAAEEPLPRPRREDSSLPAEPTAPAKEPVRSEGTRKATATKTAAKAKKAPAAKAAVRKTTMAKGASGRDGGPTLGELVLSVLSMTPGAPRTAAEVTEDLAREYSERARDTNNVRNALEGLVAKSRIERSKQKRSVHYTIPAQSAPAHTDGAVAEVVSAAEAEASEDSEQAHASV